MDFKDLIKKLGYRIIKLKGKIQTEEAKSGLSTKNIHSEN
jgi:hypothetical protein